MSTKIDKHAELYVPTVKKGSARFTACNQMQMGPRSLGEGSLYHGKYWCLLMPSTFREMMPTVVLLWDVAFSLAWHRRCKGSGGKCYPLSQVPPFDTAGSCWLKHFPACFCLLVWPRSRRLDVQRVASAWAVQLRMWRERLIAGLETFCKPLSIYIMLLVAVFLFVVSKPFAQN